MCRSSSAVVHDIVVEDDAGFVAADAGAAAQRIAVYGAPLAADEATPPSLAALLHLRLLPARGRTGITGIRMIRAEDIASAKRGALGWEVCPSPVYESPNGGYYICLRRDEDVGGALPAEEEPLALELVQTGGDYDKFQQNLAHVSCGSRVFASSFPRGDPSRAPANVADGVYGNEHAWSADAGAAGPHFIGVAFQRASVVRSIAFGRDNAGRVRTGYVGSCVGPGSCRASLSACVTSRGRCVCGGGGEVHGASLPGAVTERSDAGVRVDERRCTHVRVLDLAPVD